MNVRTLEIQVRLGPNIYIYYIYIYLYHGAWADQRLATVLQISCCPVYKWFVTQL